MAGHKILTIFLCIFLAQTAFSKPVDNSSEESSEEVEALLEELQKNGTESEKLILSRMGNFVLLPQKFTAEAVNATKYLLKDEALMANKNAEIQEFKKNLTMFLEKYDPAASLKEMHDTMEILVNTTDHYFELAEEKITPESKFIIELLNKYDIKDVAINLNDVEAFIDEWRITGSTSEKLFLFTMDSLITIPQQYAANATNATQYLLKDEALKGNLKPQVEEFKKKLNMYLEKYDPNSSNIKSIYASMNVFHNITASYYQLPVEKVTEDSKFIVEMLNKYNCQKYSITLIDHCNIFFQEFSKMFEEFKNDLEKPILDWFDEFIKLNDFAEKMLSIREFMKLV